MVQSEEPSAGCGSHVRACSQLRTWRIASDQDQDRLLQGDGSRKGNYVNQGFDFLGYGFRPRLVKNSRRGSLFWSFTPAVGRAALTAMRETIRKTNLRNRTQITLGDVANESSLTRPDRVLRALLSLSAVSDVPPCQQVAGGMGHAEVQTPRWS
jgi:hypothetical protein